MGAPLDPTTAAHVSFLESFTQPDAIRPSEIVAGIPAETEAPTSIRKRPSIVVGGDIGALAVVQLVHSPRSTSGSTSPCAVSGSVSPPTSPKVRGAWRCKLFGSTWTGPADVIISLVGLTFTLAYYTAFLRSNESRTDVASLVTLCDPILVHLPTLDCSAVLSVLVYGSLLAAVKYTHKKPDLFLEFVQTHVIVIWVRMLTLYLTPLEAPPGVVPLVDPIAYADGAVLVRDLFFSGHTATTFGLFIGIRRHDRVWKLAFGVAALLTAICVLLQKAHYTIDVVAAPFFVSAVHSFVVATRQSLSAALAKPDKHQAAKRFQSPATKAKKM